MFSEEKSCYKQKQVSNLNAKKIIYLEISQLAVFY